MKTANETSLLAHISSLARTVVTPKRPPPWYRPVVAVPTSGFTSQYGRWRTEGVESDIGRALALAGADAYYFPCRPINPPEKAFDAVWQVVRRADAVVVPGGLNEMLPGWFMRSTTPNTGSVEWWEDWWRWHLTQLSLLLCMPYLGIDQGAGYLNVVLGGDLYDDMKTDARGYGQHMAGSHADADRWIYNALEVLVPTSYIASCAPGEPHIWGACMHRQTIQNLAPTLLITARSMDSCPEIIERGDGFFGIGLWSHPEHSKVYETQAYARNLFATLCESALAYTISQASRHQEQLEARRDDIWLHLSSTSTPQLLPGLHSHHTCTQRTSEHTGNTPSQSGHTHSHSTDAIAAV
jgi:putative glutamine amidotransferase